LQSNSLEAGDQAMMTMANDSAVGLLRRANGTRAAAFQRAIACGRMALQPVFIRERSMSHQHIVIAEVTDPEEMRRARVQDERHRRNEIWLLAPQHGYRIERH
jgi:hypothetical protein